MPDRLGEEGPILFRAHLARCKGELLVADFATTAHMSIDADVVGRIGNNHSNNGAVVQPRHVAARSRVAAEQAVAAGLAHLPKIATP